jgi:hypothetical protein
VQVEQGTSFTLIIRDEAERLITYQFMGRGVESCAPSGVESNFTVKFETTGIYILSVFADGQQVYAPSHPVPAVAFTEFLTRLCPAR